MATPSPPFPSFTAALTSLPAKRLHIDVPDIVVRSVTQPPNTGTSRDFMKTIDGRAQDEYECDLFFPRVVIVEEEYDDDTNSESHCEDTPTSGTSETPNRRSFLNLRRLLFRLIGSTSRKNASTV